MVPLFNNARLNSPLVQRVKEDATVRGFEPYGAPGALQLPAPVMETSVGDPSIHAFAFGEGDVELATSDDLTPFSKRLDDPVLLKRPLVAMEVNFNSRNLTRQL